MFEIPYTYSLGPVEKFGRLAALVRGTRHWRKVARMVVKYNVLSEGLRGLGQCNYNNRNRYIVRATYSFRGVPAEVINEIYSIYGLTSPATRCMLLA